MSKSNKGLGAIVASGIVGTVIWAFFRHQQDQQAVEPAGVIQPAPQPTRQQNNVALVYSAWDVISALASGDRTAATNGAVEVGYQAATGGNFAEPTNLPIGGMGAILGLIKRHESGNDYNRVYARSRIQPPRSLTSMTVREVLAWQDSSVAAGSASSAAGAYQIIRRTLRSLVSERAIGLDDRFTSAAQDRCAMALMNRRGLAQFRAGRISDIEFAQRLSMEWASLPAQTYDRSGRRARGQSYYAGDGLNRSSTSRQSVLQAVRQIQRRGVS